VLIYKCICMYIQALAMRPDDSRFHNSLGILYDSIGDNAAALKYYQRCSLSLSCSHARVCALSLSLSRVLSLSRSLARAHMRARVRVLSLLRSLSLFRLLSLSLFLSLARTLSLALSLQLIKLPPCSTATPSSMDPR